MTSRKGDLGIGSPPPDEDLRAEDLSRPVVGDLLRPGMVVETSYGTGPYRIESVTAYAYYDRFRAWSLVMVSQVNGEFPAKSNGHSYINELVVSWEEDGPHFRHLFLANDDEVFIVADQAFRTEKSGQMSLL